MSLKRTPVLTLALVVPLLLSGCFDIEQSISLNKDLSGKAGFRMTMNMEPMMLAMLNMQRSMEEKKGPPTAAEIAKAKKEFLEQATKKNPSDEKKTMEAELPEGISIADMTPISDGLKIGMNVVFGFTDPSRLALINFPKKKGETPADKSVVDKPFEGLQVEDEGKTIVIRTKPVDPASGVAKEAKESGGGSKELEAMMQDALKGLRVAFRIEAPFPVVETNAMQKKGNVLIWEYTLETLEKMKGQDVKNLGVFVRYRK